MILTFLQAVSNSLPFRAFRVFRGSSNQRTVTGRKKPAILGELRAR